MEVQHLIIKLTYVDVNNHEMPYTPYYTRIGLVMSPNLSKNAYENL